MYLSDGGIKSSIDVNPRWFVWLIVMVSLFYVLLCYAIACDVFRVLHVCLVFFTLFFQILYLFSYFVYCSDAECTTCATFILAEQITRTDKFTNQRVSGVLLKLNKSHPGNAGRAVDTLVVIGRAVVTDGRVNTVVLTVVTVHRTGHHLISCQ